MLSRHLALATCLLWPLLAWTADFDSWAHAMSVERVRADPNQSTQSQFLPPAEQQALDSQLTPVDRAYRAQRIATSRAALLELRAFDKTTLTPAQQYSAATLDWVLQTQVDGEAFSDHRFVFSQNRGLHVSLVDFMTRTHPIRNEADVGNYLARLQQVAGQIDTGIAQARDAARRGFLMPRFITQAALGQFDRFLALAARDNALVSSLVERMKPLALGSTERDLAVANAIQIVSESIIPAYQRARALLREQLPRTNSDAGLWRLPDGEKAYRHALRVNTNTDLTPAQIHAIGQRELARLEPQMDTLLRKLGHTEGSIDARMAALEASLQPREADPRPHLLERLDSIVRDAERRAAGLFAQMPKAPVEVKRVPPLTEKTAAAHYTSPARDSSRPGIFWMPLPEAPYRIASMRSLVYHEAVPGHHYEIALSQENGELPAYRTSGLYWPGSAYSEGWALYAEQLAAESGWYGNDIAGQLGQLDMARWRAKRLIVDTGLHAMKWTRQQVIDFGISAQEVDRYVSDPGQACAYMIGMLHILELRERARRALGDRFSLKEFHAVVLGTGRVPLPTLDSAIDAWIKQRPEA